MTQEQVRYSQRLRWDAAASPFSLLLAQQNKGDKRSLLDLSISNPTIALPDYPHREITQALAELPSFDYRPEALGRLATRSAIAQWIGVPSDRLALTASTSEAYGVLFKLFCDPGDEVLAPIPSYPLFDYLADLESVRLTRYRLGYDGSWHIDFESLRNAISARTRAIILVNPNNPTGSFLKPSEYRRLAEIAARHSLPLISDEVFTHYPFAVDASGRVHSLTGCADTISFSLDGLSKSAGMPQMKLGWIAVNGPQRECERALARLELVLDTYLSVSLPVQLAAERLLSIGSKIRAQIQRRLHANLTAVDHLLTGRPMHRLNAEGGWSAILRVPNVMTEEQWITRLLLEHDTIVQPGYFFDLPAEAAYLVVSLLTEETTFREGIRRLSGIIQS